jgi:hypothetical protein
MNLVFLRIVRRLLITASDVLSTPIIFTMMKEALKSSETSVLTRVIRLNILEGAILQIRISLISQTANFVNTSVPQILNP